MTCINLQACLPILYNIFVTAPERWLCLLHLLLHGWDIHGFPRLCKYSSNVFNQFVLYSLGSFNEKPVPLPWQWPVQNFIQFHNWIHGELDSFVWSNQLFIQIFLSLLLLQYIKYIIILIIIIIIIIVIIIIIIPIFYLEAPSLAVVYIEVLTTRCIFYSDTIGHIRILSIGLELACSGGYCGEIFSNANNF